MGQRPRIKKAELPQRRAGQDQVELTNPRRTALNLLRQRVLEHTRRALELPKAVADTYHFCRVPDQSAAVFMGRLLSDQNLLASHRRGSWDPARVDEAMERSLSDGMAETLEVLHEVDALHMEDWDLINQVMQEFFRKLTGQSPEEVRQKFWADLEEV